MCSHLPYIEGYALVHPLELNIFFLANVLRVLMTQLQRHSNEPSNYRRALKATVILVPLFGLQLLLVIYRPGDYIEENATYEIFTKIINNSQGMAVTAVFCFMNGEVHNMLRGRIVCQGHHDSNPDIISGSVSMADVRRGCYPGGNSSHAETYSLRKIPVKQSSDSSRNGCRRLKLSRKPQKSSRKDWEEQNHLTNTTNI
ncbi:hypothetical protein Btru_042747 [Bulinus truncatus]|nr:hypothetical protein Btru_042747 [Bulinus truncatus]